MSHTVAAMASWRVMIHDAESQVLAAEREQHKRAMREWMAARAWADCEISELRLREV